MKREIYLDNSELKGRHSERNSKNFEDWMYQGVQ